MTRKDKLMACESLDGKMNVYEAIKEMDYMEMGKLLLYIHDNEFTSEVCGDACPLYLPCKECVEMDGNVCICDVMTRMFTVLVFLNQDYKKVRPLIEKTNY